MQALPGDAPVKLQPPAKGSVNSSSMDSSDLIAVNCLGGGGSSSSAWTDGSGATDEESVCVARSQQGMARPSCALSEAYQDACEHWEAEEEQEREQAGGPQSVAQEVAALAARYLAGGASLVGTVQALWGCASRPGGCLSEVESALAAMEPQQPLAVRVGSAGSGQAERPSLAALAAGLAELRDVMAMLRDARPGVWQSVSEGALQLHYSQRDGQHYFRGSCVLDASADVSGAGQGC